MIINKTHGLVAAPFTPMKADGEINVPVIPAYAEKLKKDGLKGAFVCGTTGEGMLMSTAERKLVAEKWIEEQTESFKIIVHIGSTSSKQSKELARHAQDSGAHSTACMGPAFLQPERIEELVSFCAEAASGSPLLPFYYYHIPPVSGVNLSMSKFLKQVPSIIPNFVGIKFTDNNLMELQLCLNMDGGKWDILNGYDQLLLAGLAFGVKGAVGSTYNFMAPIYNSIIKDFENGRAEEARKKQFDAVKVIEVLIKYGGAIVTGKALMSSFGINCGKCRTPLKNLDETQYQKFIEELKGSGFFEIINL